MKRSSAAYWWEDFKAARGSLALVVLWFAVQAWMTWFVDDPQAVYLDWGLSREAISSGHPVACLSYGLLHGGWTHVSFNALAMLLLGARIERISGTRFLLLLVLGGVLAGGVFHLVFESERILVGGSGGVLAGLLYLIGISPEARMWLIRVSGKNLGRGILLGSGLLMVTRPQLGWPVVSAMGEAIEKAIPVGIYAVSHACHVGGSIVGMLAAAWMLRPPPTLAQLRRDREKKEGSPNISGNKLEIPPPACRGGEREGREEFQISDFKF